MTRYNLRGEIEIITGTLGRLLAAQLVDLQPVKKKLLSCFVSVRVLIFSQIQFRQWWLQQVSVCLP
jgi:hypothetical protein